MLAGTYGGEEVSLSKMFEAVGAYKAGMITDAQLEDCTCKLLPQLRQLLGHVHRQQHELPVRGGGHRPCPATAPSPPSTPSGCSWPSTRAWP